MAGVDVQKMEQASKFIYLRRFESSQVVRSFAANWKKEGRACAWGS